MELILAILGFLWDYKFTLLITASVTCVCKFLVGLHQNRKKYSHLPGPPVKSFLMGNAGELKELDRRGGCFFDYLTEQSYKYGKTFRLSISVIDMVFTTDPEIVKELYVTGHHLKPSFGIDVMSRMFCQRFLGEGLVTIINPKKWAWKRSILNPVFQKSYLLSSLEQFNVVADNLMDRLKGLADGKTEVLMLDEFNHVALDIVSKVAFGIDVNSVNVETPFTKAILVSFTGLSRYMMSREMIFNPLNWKFVWEVRKSIQFIREYGRKVLRERKAAKDRGDYVPDDSLTYIIRMKEEDPNLDEEETLDEFVTFFVAGQETTAALMSFTVLLLGQHPDVLKRLQDEIDDVLGEKSTVEYGDIVKMPYLDMVLKETLRLYPPVASGSRTLSKDIDIGGYKLQAGTFVCVSSYVSARMEDLFENPKDFNPDRFDPNNEKKVDAYSYFPFSLGPRTCIGKHFADIEAKVVMAKFIQKFSYKLVEGQTLNHELVFTLRPKGRSRCFLTLRDKK